MEPSNCLQKKITPRYAHVSHRLSVDIMADQGTMYRVIAYFTQSSKDFLYIGMIFALIGLGVSVGLIRPGVSLPTPLYKSKSLKRLRLINLERCQRKKRETDQQNEDYQ